MGVLILYLSARGGRQLLALRPELQTGVMFLCLKETDEVGPEVLSIFEHKVRKKLSNLWPIRASATNNEKGGVLTPPCESRY